MILGVVALALGAAGLGVALTHAGQTGATGSQGSAGPQGPPGPGSLVASAHTYDETEFNVSTCVSEQGAEVTIVVPSAGTLFVQTDAVLSFNHTAGTVDLAYLYITNESGVCTTSQFWSYAEVPSGTPTGGWQADGSVIESYPVAAGTYTFFTTVYDQYGDTNNIFFGAELTAVFYPA
jgi:hypothetical protein